MSAVNEQDVINQLESFGLDITGKYEIGKAMRCHWSGEDRRNNKGWFWLNESVFDDGNTYITGGYGVWHGDDNNAQKVAINGDYKPSKEDQALMRKQLADQRRRAAAELKAKQAKAAEEAARRWRDLSVEGSSGYLVRKQVQAHGVRFDPTGIIAVPVADVTGKKHGIQWILDRKNDQHSPEIERLHGTDKQFWPAGLKITGNFHMIGVPDPKGIILLAEGYATGASLHEASGHAVAVTFNANNVLPVLKNLKAHYKRASFLICADDDYLCRCSSCKKQTPVADAEGFVIPCSHCGEPHKKNNTGIRVATNACADVSGASWVIPQFTARDGRKITDFNDLHVEESLQAVAAQVNDAVAAKFPASGEVPRPARDAQPGGAGKAELRLLSVDESVDRYSYVYGPKDTMFDHYLYKLVSKTCVLDITRGRAWDEMKGHPDFKIVDIDGVGFDATGTDSSVLCNMYSGMEAVSDDRESCEFIKSIVDFLVSGEKEPRKVRHELYCWLAYPLQHPGAKIDWSVVLHGDQGAGKNFIFERVMMTIYGKYSTLIGQEALEDKFNEWASKKLYVVADEVVARQELYHTKNVLKKYITGKYIPINPKNVAKYSERNQMNFVFLSNEDKPVVLESKDRRYLIIRTPETPPPEGMFAKAGEELENGGVESFHHFLLEYDCKDFDPHGKPMMTLSKEELMALCKEPPVQFVDDWLDEDLNLPVVCCLLDDLYQCFKRWCDRSGERFVPTKRSFSSQLQRHPNIQTGRRAKKAVVQSDGKTKPMNVVLVDSDPKPVEQTWSEFLSPQIQKFKLAAGDF